MGSKPVLWTSTRNVSAFRNEKLYAVVEFETRWISAAEPRKLLDGSIGSPLKTDNLS